MRFLGLLNPIGSETFEFLGDDSALLKYLAGDGGMKANGDADSGNTKASISGDAGSASELCIAGLVIPTRGSAL